MSYTDILLQSFQTVINAAHPRQSIAPYIPEPPKGRMVVIGAGKASAAMAAAFEKHYEGPLEGIVITRYGHAVDTQHIQIIEAAHPVPDEAGQNAVADIMALLKTLTADDLVICLISGGGSSLLSRPVDGIPFTDLQSLQQTLLGSGASITEMNIVRKNLNIALGGGLAKAAARVPMITLAISDVVGDDPSIIASGATVPDPSSLQDAKQVLARYKIQPPDTIKAALDNAKNETPKPGDPIFNNKSYQLIATPTQSLQAAQQFWQAQGYDARIWNAEIEGDSQQAAHDHVEYVLSQQSNRPLAIISGGETTMTLKEDAGKGGPNTHFMLCAAQALQGHPGIYAMACDTDGIDGDGDHAGAIITPETLSQAQEVGLKAEDFIARQDSYHFFSAINALVKPGPTYTNVNDYRVFLRLPEHD